MKPSVIPVVSTRLVGRYQTVQSSFPSKQRGRLRDVRHSNNKPTQPTNTPRNRAATPDTFRRKRAVTPDTFRRKDIHPPGRSLAVNPKRNRFNVNDASKSYSPLHHVRRRTRKHHSNHNRLSYTNYASFALLVESPRPLIQSQSLESFHPRPARRAHRASITSAPMPPPPEPRDRKMSTRRYAKSAVKPTLRSSPKPSSSKRKQHHISFGSADLSKLQIGSSPSRTNNHRSLDSQQSSNTRLSKASPASPNRRKSQHGRSCAGRIVRQGNGEVNHGEIKTAAPASNQAAIRDLKHSIKRIVRMRPEIGKSDSQGEGLLSISKYGLGKRLSKEEMKMIEQLHKKIDTYAANLMNKAQTDRAVTRALEVCSKLAEIKSKFAVGRPLGGGTAWYYREGGAKYSLDLLEHVNRLGCV